MTVRYVGPGGNDANSGLSWAQRKLTLNGAEDTPVVAGDIVYVGPGTYRETLTVDVSGGVGNVIQYIGDYDGSHTDGVGGVIRVTGSDNDQTAVRANGITATTKTYRSFTNFRFDMTTSHALNLATGCANWTISKCLFSDISTAAGVYVTGAAQANIAIVNCAFRGMFYGVYFFHSATVSNAGHTIGSCFFEGNAKTSEYGIETDRVGGITVSNCVFLHHRGGCVGVVVALAVGQTVVVGNSTLADSQIGFIATALGEIVEDYNSISGITTARTNTNAGVHSNPYPPLFDGRWFFQLVNAGAGPSSATQVVTPWDLASYSQLVNAGGTSSPTATDMRGTGTIGAQREWGALEYDSTLKIQGGGGAVSISPHRGNIG